MKDLYTYVEMTEKQYMIGSHIVFFFIFIFRIYVMDASRVV